MEIAWFQEGPTLEKLRSVHYSNICRFCSAECVRANAANRIKAASVCVC